MHNYRPAPAVDGNFWIGAAWACGFSAAVIALVVGVWRLAWAL